MTQDPSKDKSILNEQIVTATSGVYAANLVEVISSMFATNLVATEPTFFDLAALADHNDHDLTISLMFTGSFYGEFIMATNLQMAQKFLNLTPANETEAKQQVAEILAELLNMVAGQSLTGLINEHTKLTLTAPKVFFGTIKYPRLKSGKTSLLLEQTPAIDCIVYLDQMRLDIDSSYKNALDSLTSANADLQKAMEQLHVQQKQLIQAEKLMALGTMAAGVAHEINTPLSTILLAEGQMKTVLESEAFDKAKLSRMLAVIETTVHKISKVTQTLRFYASDSHGEAFESSNLEAIIQQPLILLAETIEKNQIKIIIDPSIARCELECRPKQIAQVFFDLLQNSLHAIENLPQKWIHIQCIENNNAFEISVKDSGHGLPSEIQEKVFDPFFTTKEFGQGTGLGLSHARGILKSHKASIKLNPNCTNTEFVLVIPKTHSSKAA